MSDLDEALSDRHRRRAVAAVFVVLGVVTGVTFYSMSAYIDALIRTGQPVWVASLAPTLTSVAGGLGGLWVARLLGRLRTRVLMLGGATVAAAALAAVGQVHRPWQLCLVFLIFGAATAFTSTVPCSDLIARWFDPAPARAISLASSGMSVGGALTPPVVLAALGRYGLSLGTAFVALGFFGVVGLASVALREPAGGRRATTVGAPGPGGPPSGRSRIPPKPFPILFAAFAMLIFSQVGTVTHVLRIATERGLDGGSAALPVIAASSLTARLLGVPLVSVLGIRRFALIVALSQAVAQAVLAQASTLPQLLVGAALLGTTMGNTFVLMSLFVLSAFHLREYPRTYAWLAMAGTVGSACGPLFLGLADSSWGSYRQPLLVMATASAVGAALLFLSGVDDGPATVGEGAADPTT